MAKCSALIVFGEVSENTGSFFLEDNSEGLAEKLAEFTLVNNQWAEIMTLANEKINDADWRASHVVETF